MTQIFNEDGVLTPVTVLQAGPCVVTQDVYKRQPKCTGNQAGDMVFVPKSEYAEDR